MTVTRDAGAYGSGPSNRKDVAYFRTCETLTFPVAAGEYVVGPAEFIRTQRMTTLASCPTIVASVLLATAPSLSVGV
jgi:hypothetical protein